MREENAMPIYEFRCLECDEVFSRLFLRSTDAGALIACSACGSDQTQRLISSFAIGGKVDPGPGRAAWPTAWNDTNGGDPETLRYWRHRIEREARLEEKYPELRDRSLQSGGDEVAPEAVVHSHSHGEHHHHHHSVEPVSAEDS
jgi:putative FmdB family regulatory protein